jgi:hypothetical protein
MTKVGDTLWNNNHNFRSSSWGSDVITGETKQSWLVGTRKVNKRTLLQAIPRFTPIQWYTEEGKRAEDFHRLHARDIAGRVSVCRDIDKLKQIAALVGMELES